VALLPPNVPVTYRLLFYAVTVYLDKSEMIEAAHLKPKGLAAATGTKFDARETHGESYETTVSIFNFKRRGSF
jgi:hypothetical protein